MSSKHALEMARRAAAGWEEAGVSGTARHPSDVALPAGGGGEGGRGRGGSEGSGGQGGGGAGGQWEASEHAAPASPTGVHAQAEIQLDSVAEVVQQNVRNLRANDTYIDFLRMMERSRYAVFLVQEHHRRGEGDAESRRLARSMGFEARFAYDATEGHGGAAIFVRTRANRQLAAVEDSQLTFRTHDITHGGAVSAQLALPQSDGSTVTVKLASLYVPTAADERLTFIQELARVQQSDCPAFDHDTIVAGDMNVVADVHEDIRYNLPTAEAGRRRQQYQQNSNQHADELELLFADADLVDGRRKERRRRRMRRISTKARSADRAEPSMRQRSETKLPPRQSAPRAGYGRRWIL